MSRLNKKLKRANDKVKLADSRVVAMTTGGKADKDAKSKVSNKSKDLDESPKLGFKARIKAFDYFKVVKLLGATFATMVLITAYTEIMPYVVARTGVLSGIVIDTSAPIDLMMWGLLALSLIIPLSIGLIKLIGVVFNKALK